MEEIRRQTIQGLSYTPYLKIKLDANLARAAETLKIIQEEYQARVGTFPPTFSLPDGLVTNPFWHTWLIPSR